MDRNGHKKKVLTSVGLPELDDTSSRQYLYGSSLCIDSISPSRIEKACSLVTTYLQDYVDIDHLSVSPSPLLQDYMVCQPEMDDGVTLTTYCERVSTVRSHLHCKFKLLQIQPKTRQFFIIPRSLRVLLSLIRARGRTVLQYLHSNA